MYFVVKNGLNYSNTKMQNLVCGGQYCNSDSVSTQIFIASKQANRYITKRNGVMNEFNFMFVSLSLKNILNCFSFF